MTPQGLLVLGNHQKPGFLSSVVRTGFRPSTGARDKLFGFPSPRPDVHGKTVPLLDQGNLLKERVETSDLQLLLCGEVHCLAGLTVTKKSSAINLRPCYLEWIGMSQSSNFLFATKMAVPPIPAPQYLPRRGAALSIRSTHRGYPQFRASRGVALQAWGCLLPPSPVVPPVQLAPIRMAMDRTQFG